MNIATALPLPPVIHCRASELELLAERLRHEGRRIEVAERIGCAGYRVRTAPLPASPAATVGHCAPYPSSQDGLGSAGTTGGTKTREASNKRNGASGNERGEALQPTSHTMQLTRTNEQHQAKGQDNA